MSPKFKDKFTGVSAHLLSSISLTHGASNSYISLAIQGRGITSGKTKKTDALLRAVNILLSRHPTESPRRNQTVSN